MSAGQSKTAPVAPSRKLAGATENAVQERKLAPTRVQGPIAIRYSTITCRAGDRTRTGDVQLGKLAFYQLNYARRSPARADAPTSRISPSAEMSGSPFPIRIPANKKASVRSEADNERQSGEETRATGRI